MEEKKKLDFSQMFGFLLIGAVLLWFSYKNKEESKAEETVANTEQIVQATTTDENTNLIVSDSAKAIQATKQYGDFAHNIISGIDAEATTTLENEVLRITVANKGGQIVKAEIKEYKTYNQLPLYMINDNNASFNINFGTTNNRVFNTKDLIFQPSLTKNGENQILSVKLKVSETKYLEYRYELKPNDYMLGFAIQSVGLENIINSSSKINLELDYTAFRHEKSVKYENQMTALHYEKEDNEFDDLSAAAEDDEEEENVNWIGFKQHFFSTIFLTDKAFKTAKLESKSLVKNYETDTIATKQFKAVAPLALNNGSINYSMNIYVGPNDYNTLKSYDRGIENVMNLGWGIFGFINKNVFIPIFNLLGGVISNYGLVIILMTIVVRLIMSPLVYKSYVSSAKMKVLKPEMEALNAKYPGKENAMKRQQEVMALQRKSGVNMMAGCIPALLQMPVFFALFRFFPSEIDLRQKPFLWADDLSSYDSVFEWTTHIPILSNIYGNHFSLFPVLASIAIFFYMRMNQGQQMSMQQPAQEGMPDMQKMMKMMIYFSPIMMLFFFNNYASGLSLYYFISNLLTLTIMFVIKNYVIDDKKILAKIEENRKKPQKQSKFKQRLEEAMKQAQAQQAAQSKNKK